MSSSINYKENYDVNTPRELTLEQILETYTARNITGLKKNEIVDVLCLDHVTGGEMLDDSSRPFYEMSRQELILYLEFLIESKNKS